MASDDEDFYEEFDDDDIFWVEESDPTAAVRLLPTAIAPTPRTKLTPMTIGRPSRSRDSRPHPPGRPLPRNRRLFQRLG
jgi:hypothetical protein